MQRILHLVAPLLLVVTACTNGAAPQTTVDDTTTTVAPPPGTMAITSGSGDVAIVDVSGIELLRRSAADGNRFSQPVWLDAATIVTSVAAGTSHRVMAMDSVAGSTIWEAELPTPSFFMLPSPPGGRYATTSLRNNSSGTGLVAELIDTFGDVTLLSEESPFYASWSPDGLQLAIHASADHLDIRSSDGTVTVARPTGIFQTPSWIDEGLVTMRSTAGGQTLSIWNGIEFRDIGLVDGPVRFVASDRFIALQSVPSESGAVEAAVRTQTTPSLPAGRLVVIDLQSGSTTSITGELTPMFQWDPGGTKLLFATYEDESSLDFGWHVWQGGSIADLGIHEIQEDWFRTVAPFFDQYAQAVSLWSGDGSRFAVPAVIDGENVVVIQTVAGGAPVVIGDATWVAFAP